MSDRVTVLSLPRHSSCTPYIHVVDKLKRGTYNLVLHTLKIQNKTFVSLILKTVCNFPKW